MRPSVSPPWGPHPGSNSWPNRTRHAAKESLAMQAGAGACTRAASASALDRAHARRVAIPEPENPHAYAENQPQHKAPPAEPKFTHGIQTHTSPPWPPHEHDLCTLCSSSVSSAHGALKGGGSDADACRASSVSTSSTSCCACV